MDDTLEFNLAANNGGLSSRSLCSPSPLSLYSDPLVVFGNSKGVFEENNKCSANLDSRLEIYK